MSLNNWFVCNSYYLKDVKYRLLVIIINKLYLHSDKKLYTKSHVFYKINTKYYKQ